MKMVHVVQGSDTINFTNTSASSKKNKIKITTIQIKINIVKHFTFTEKTNCIYTEMLTE